MFNEIAWSDYFTAVLFILVLYYTAVFVIYFPHEIKEFMGSRSFLSKEAVEHEPHQLHDEYLLDLDDTVARINAILKKSGADANKALLLEQLKEILNDFDGLAVPAYRGALYNHIISESASLYGITISEEDLG